MRANLKPSEINYVGSSPTIGIFLYVTHTTERSSSSLRNTHHSQGTDTHAPGGIRAHNLSRRGAVDRPATWTGKVSHLRIENEN